VTEHKLWTRSFLVITVENFLVAMNFIVLVAVVAKFVTAEFGASSTVAGLAAGIFILGAVFTRPLCGKWMHRIGQKRMLLGGLLLSLAFTLAYLLADSTALLLPIRFVHGAVFAAAHVAAGTIVTGVVPRERYGEGIGYYALSQILANALGPFAALLLIQHSDFDSVIIAAAATVALGLVILPFLSVKEVALTDGQLREAAGFKLRSFIEPKAVPIALVTMLLYLCYASLVAFLALYAEEIRLVGTASVFFIVYATVVFLARPFVGRWFDLKGENRVMYPAILGFAIGLAVFSQARSSWMLLLAAVINGVGFGALQSSGQTIAVKSAPLHRMGLATSTFFLFADVGVGIGPLLTGLVIASIGYRGAFGVLAAVVAACLPLYYGLHGRSSHPARDTPVARS
jgi:MFS family permease